MDGERLEEVEERLGVSVRRLSDLCESYRSIGSYHQPVFSPSAFVLHLSSACFLFVLSALQQLTMIYEIL